MIDRVLNIIGIDTEKKEVKLQNCPEYRILNKDPNGKPCKQKCNYRSDVGCLSYIQAMISPDITMTVQQCAIFFNDPSQEHKDSVKHICRYF